MLSVIPIDGGPLSSRSYIIQVEEECWIVDCGDYPALKAYLTKPIRGILLTHAHFDHIKGFNELLVDFPLVDIYTNDMGMEMLMDSRKNLSHYHESDFYLKDISHINIVKDRDSINLNAGNHVESIFTPGHNPSCITWLLEDSIFTGDSYIPGTKTVTNLPGGNRLQAQKSIELITELKIGRTVYPGHNIEIPLGTPHL